MTAAQEGVDMRSGCHAAKILPVGVRGTKNVWCLSSLIFPSTTNLSPKTGPKTRFWVRCVTLEPCAVGEFLSRQAVTPQLLYQV